MRTTEELQDFVLQSETPQKRCYTSGSDVVVSVNRAYFDETHLIKASTHHTSADSSEASCANSALTNASRTTLSGFGTEK